MPWAYDVNDIVVTGVLPGGSANEIMAMYMMINLVGQDSPDVRFLAPTIGIVGEHVVQIKWGSLRPPLKPELAEAQIDALRDAYVRVGEVVASLSDTAVYNIGPVEMTGAEIKGAFFALKEINLTEDIYPAGYGGANRGDILDIGYSTAAGWNRHGAGGGNFILLHEMVHNTPAGRAVVQQNFDRHLAAGGTRSDYKEGSYHFLQQEQMTNTLVKQFADQAGIAIQSNQASPGGYPYPGYYIGNELDPPE